MNEQQKREVYERLMPELRSLVADEPDLIANMANVSTELHEALGPLWTGFYRVVGEDLVLGPYCGPLACTRIARGRGVCGTAWAQNRTLIVPDVHQFPGHIACSTLSRSEIVVPVRREGTVIAVIDIDSRHLGAFTDTDAHYLEQVAKLFE